MACVVAYLVVKLLAFALVPFLAVPWYRSVPIIGIIAVCLLGVGRLAAAGKITAAAFLLPLLLWAEMLFGALFTGGILSVFFPLFTMVVILSAVLIGPKGDALFIPLNIAAAVVLYVLGARGLLPASRLSPHPLVFLASSAVTWFLAGSAVFLSHRGPLDLIPGARRRDAVLVEQTRSLHAEIEQRREIEKIAAARTRSLLAASRMAVQCATAPRGTDPLKLIAEQIHEVTGAVGTIVSTFDAKRSELQVRHIVLPEPLRAIANGIMGRNTQAMVLPLPRGAGKEVISAGIVETTELGDLTYGLVPSSISWALKKALKIERFTGLGLHDGEELLATVLVGMPPRARFLDPEVVEIFSTVATMLLRERKAQDLAQDSESRFKDMIDQLPQSVLELDRSGVIVCANQRAQDDFGIAGDGTAGTQEAIDLVIAEDRQAAVEEFAAVLTGRPQRRREFTMVRADGSRFTAVISASPIRQGGHRRGVRGVIADVSSVRRAEERVRESQEMLRLAIDLIPHAIFWKDGQSVYRGCNRVFAEWAGLARHEDAVGMTDAQMPWAADADRYRQVDQRILISGAPLLDYLQPMTTSIGSQRQVRVSKLPMHNAQGRVLGVLGIAEDITAWNSSEAERLLLGTAIEKAVEIVVITDESGAIQYVNPAFLKKYGYERGEVLGRNPRILKSDRHDESYYRDLWTTVGSGKVWQGSLHNRRKDGTPLIEEAIISPVLAPNGETLHYVKVARDVTYEVDLEARYQQAQKMEAVGRLAGGVAHDFNNILTVISGYGEILAHRLGRDGAWSEEIGAIVEASARAAALTGQLLAFSRKQQLEPQVIEPNAVVRGIEQMLRRLIGEDIVLGSTLEPSLGTIFVDKGQIEQVILNLAVNARDAMPKGGRLHLGTRRVTLDREHREAHGSARPGEYAVLEVSDTGTGMSEEVKAHMFEPFFTTKPEHKGTGLGLATVYGIVTQSGGFIEVDSQPGQGTRFQIFFPLFKGAEAAGTASTASFALSAGGGERILLAEDDPAIRRLLVRSLAENGFIVTETANTAEALQCFRAEPGAFQLLLSDVIMPGLSGPDLAELLRKEQPGMKVLFISGYTANETSEYALSGFEVNLLQKPFSMEELARRVRATLDRD
jgi:PAS domain S-box-containing protein